jgi:O-antigen/teichoic acid export membrane protein
MNPATSFSGSWKRAGRSSLPRAEATALTVFRLRAVADARSAPGRVATNTIARAAGEAVAKAASLAFYIVLARQLGSEDYGAFVFALAWTGALLIGAGFGTDELIAREVARDRSGAGRYLSNVVALKAVTAALLLGVAMAVVFIGGYSAAERAATLLVGLGVVAEVVAKSWHSIFQGYERLELISACLILQRVLTAVVGIAILLAGGGLVAAALVYMGGALAGLAAAELLWRRFTYAHRPRPTRAGAWALLIGGLPIGVAALLWVVLLKVDVLMLSFLASNRAVGLYAAASRLVEGTQFVAWAFDAAMLPWIARTTGPRLERGYMLGLKFLFAALLPVGLLVACFSGAIIALLYGSDFAGAATPLALLAPGIALYGLQSLSGTLLIARDAPGVLVRVAGFVAVQNIACNAVAIPLWGADGAAAVALSSSLLMTVLTIFFARRRVGGLALVRAFVAPLLAGGALVAVALVLPFPPVAAGAVALVAYAAVLVAIELSAHRDDVETYRRSVQIPALSSSGLAKRMRRSSRRSP